jgi:hypothetical protein
VAQRTVDSICLWDGAKHWSLPSPYNPLLTLLISFSISPNRLTPIPLPTHIFILLPPLPVYFAHAFSTAVYLLLALPFNPAFPLPVRCTGRGGRARLSPTPEHVTPPSLLSTIELTCYSSLAQKLRSACDTFPPLIFSFSRLRFVVIFIISSK